MNDEYPANFKDLTKYYNKIFGSDFPVKLLGISGQFCLKHNVCLM